MVKLLSHIILSALLLISTTGMTINMHFCQGHLYDLAVNAQASDCCRNDSDDNICHHDQQHDHDKSRSHQCENKTIKIKSTNDFLVSVNSFDFKDSHSLDLFNTQHLLIEIPEAENSSNTNLFNYIKPPPEEVVLSQIQSFLL